MDQISEMIEERLTAIDKNLEVKERKLKQVQQAVKKNANVTPSKNDTQGGHTNEDSPNRGIGTFGQRKNTYSGIEKNYSNALLPRLPFVKQGERISKYGAGISRIIANQQPVWPASPSIRAQQNLELMEHNELNEHLVSPDVMDAIMKQHTSLEPGKTRNRHKIQLTSTTNQLKSRRDFISILQSYNQGLVSP